VKIHLTSTSRIVEVVDASGGVVPGRVWEGTTESGIAVFAVITRIAADRGVDGSINLGELDAELSAQAAPPSPASFDAIPHRLIL
jgi:hypothetical protein